MKTYLLAPALVLALAAPAGAQGLRGLAPGADPAAREMVERLRELIEKAERTRSADPWLLRALRDLAGRYDFPWRKVIVRDDFGDGDYTRSPTWHVGAGRFSVDRRLGLYTSVAPVAESSGPPAGGRGGDLAGAILGAILEKQLGRSGAGGGAGGAEIYLRRPIDNAFALRVTFAATGQGGRLEFAFFEGSKRRRGYRLVLRTGVRGGAEVLRVSRRGGTVRLGASGPLPSAGGGQQRHTLVWSHDPSGQMRVALDGQVLVQTADRTAPGFFDGFAIVNLGGEYAFREVAIYAMK